MRLTYMPAEGRCQEPKQVPRFEGVSGVARGRSLPAEDSDVLAGFEELSCLEFMHIIGLRDSIDLKRCVAVRYECSGEQP